MEVMSGWGRLPRPVLVLSCDPYRCGYRTRSDGRVEKVVADHYRACGLVWPDDALSKISGDGPEMLVSVREALGEESDGSQRER